MESLQHPLECVLMQHFWKGYNVCMVRAFLVSSFGFTAYEYALKFAFYEPELSTWSEQNKAFKFRVMKDEY